MVMSTVLAPERFIPDGAAIPSALARDMGIAPEITRVRGRAGNMALVHVPFRAAPSVMP